MKMRQKSGIRGSDSEKMTRTFNERHVANIVLTGNKTKKTIIPFMEMVFKKLNSSIKLTNIKAF